MGFSPVIQNTQSGSEQARPILPTDSAIASGAIQSGHLADGTVVSGSIASGQIGPNHLGSGAVLSGAIASGQVGQNHHSSGSVTSGAVASGQIGHFHISSGAITSGSIGMAGVPDGTKVFRDDFTWVTNAATVTSGTITTDKLASGLETIASGVMIQCMTTELISGCKAVNSFFASTSGYMNVRIAYPSAGLGRLPACGIVIDNVASGTLANVYIKGNIFPSGQLTNTAGTPVYIGLSGQLAQNPNNTISGNQVLGYQTSHSGMFVECSPVTNVTNGWLSRNEGGLSPFLSGTVQRNDLSSGLIGSGHIGTNAVNSGNISLASVGTEFISSGAIQSGQLASGAIQSGSIQESSLLSGARSPQAGVVTAFNNFLTAEIISGDGARAVMLQTVSGTPTVFIAHADGLSGFMAADGVTIDNTLSGQAIRIYKEGVIRNIPSPIAISGKSQNLFVSFSGTFTPTPNPGPLGNIDQSMGKSIGGSGGNVDLLITPFATASGLRVQEAHNTYLEAFADEMISGGRFVYLTASTSGVSIAKAGDPTKMPAIGWVNENTLSGTIAKVVTAGQMELGGINEGQGLSVIVGMSGDANSLAGLSTMSGAIIQQIGVFNRQDTRLTMMMCNLPIESGLVMYHHLASGCITSGHLANFSVGGQAILGTNCHIMSGSISSQDLAGFAVVSGKIQTNAVNSGNISSGVIGLNHLSSGLAVPVLAEWYICAETISGMKAVCFASGDGDSVVRAERQSGLRLPAIGVTISGAVSGTACVVVILGRITGGAASGAVASGFHGRPLYVGSGGHLVNASGFMGGTSSGAPTLSGSMVQRVGIAISGGIFVNCDVTITSGLQSGLLMFQ